MRAAHEPTHHLASPDLASRRIRSFAVVTDALKRQAVNDEVRPPRSTTGFSSRAEQLDGIREAIDRVNSWGITSLREAGGSREQVEMLRELYEQGDLTVRIDWAYDVDPSVPAESIKDIEVLATVLAGETVYGRLP